MSIIILSDDKDMYQLEDGEKYKLTESEMGWLAFVDGRACIADHMRDNMVDDVYTMDSYGLGEAISKDSGMFPKAVCLSDDSTLQRIFFYSAIEVEV